MNSTLTRESLGSFASLGTLYNAYNDSFCSYPIFRGKPSAECIAIIDNNSVEVAFHQHETYSDKLNVLNIKGELQLSVVAGLVKLEGYGKFLDNEKTSARSIQLSLLYSILTKTESLDLSKDALKNSIAAEVLASKVSEGLATHFVTGIQWGAKSIITLEYANSENKSKEEVGRMLRAEFGNISPSIKRSEANVVHSSQDEDKVFKFDLEAFGDFLPENQLPQTVDDAIQLMKEMPRLAQDANGGKGKPILYTLTPLALLVEMLQLNIQKSIIIIEINQVIAQQFVTLFDQMKCLRNVLNDLKNDIKQNHACLSENSFTEVAETLSKLSLAETSLRGDLRQLVTAVRAGKVAVKVLTNKFNEQKIIESTQLFLRSTFVNISEKIAFVKTLQSLGVLYVGKETSLRKRIIKFHEKEIIIFFYSSKATDSALCRKNQGLFLSMIHENNTEGKDKRVFILADIDIYPEHSTNEGVGDGVRICLYRNGEHIDRDLLLELKFRAKPHVICNTTYVNDARAVIMNLAKPLGDISLNICTNIALSNDKLKESESYKASEKDLESKLRFQQQTVVKVDLDYPRIVCTSPKCCKFYTDPSSGQTLQEFNKIYHDKCKLTGVSSQVVNNSDLLNCVAKKGSKKCNGCNCSWEKHMLITYVVDVTNSSVDQQLTHNRSAQQKLDDFRQSLEDRIKQLQKETEVILNVCAQFALFLHCSATAPFNDAFGNYISYLNEKEKSKIAVGGRDDVKKQLGKMRDAYKINLVEAFNKFDQTSTQAAHNQEDLTPDHIHQMVQSLFELPENGAALKTLYSPPNSASFTKPTNKNNCSIL